MCGPRREIGIGSGNRLRHGLRAEVGRGLDEHGGNRLLGIDTLKRCEIQIRRILHHGADRLYIRVDRRIHARSRRAQATDDAARHIVKLQPPVCGHGDAAAAEDVTIANVARIALQKPRPDREVRRRIEADQLHRYRAAAGICRRQEKLRRGAFDARQGRDFCKARGFHVELKRLSLHEHAFQAAVRLRRLGQNENVRSQTLLKAIQAVLQTQDDERTAEERQSEQRRHQPQRGGARRIPAAVPHGKKACEAHRSSPFR